MKVAAMFGPVAVEFEITTQEAFEICDKMKLSIHELITSISMDLVSAYVEVRKPE